MNKATRITTFVITLFLLMTCLTGCQDNSFTFDRTIDEFMEKLNDWCDGSEFIVDKEMSDRTVFKNDDGIALVIAFNTSNNKVKNIDYTLNKVSKCSEQTKKNFKEACVNSLRIMNNEDKNVHKAFESSIQFVLDGKQDFYYEQYRYYYSVSEISGDVYFSMEGPHDDIHKNWPK